MKHIRDPCNLYFRSNAAGGGGGEGGQFLDSLKSHLLHFMRNIFKSRAQKSFSAGSIGRSDSARTAGRGDRDSSLRSCKNCAPPSFPDVRSLVRRMIDTSIEILGYPSRIDFINTHGVRYNCRGGNILHKHINSPGSPPGRDTLLFSSPRAPRSLRPIEKRVRAAAGASRAETAVFIVIIFSCLFLARISNRKSTRPRRLLKLSRFALASPPSLSPLISLRRAARCSRDSGVHTWPGKAIIYKYPNVIFHLRSVSLITRAIVTRGLVDKWKTDVNFCVRSRRRQHFFSTSAFNFKRRLIALSLPRFVADAIFV